MEGTVRRLLAAMLATLLWASQDRTAQAQGATRLFAVGISGGFTGAVMTATAYSDGSVVIHREEAGRTARDERRFVPLSSGAVKAATAVAVRRQVFAIPHAAQDAVFGADVPVLSLTVYSANGVRSVHAMGSERNHVAGTGRFFPVWRLFYALAGYPGQVG
jgi:hypothetical protein